MGDIDEHDSKRGIKIMKIDPETPYKFGWVRENPDIRDCTPHQKLIAPLLKKALAWCTKIEDQKTVSGIMITGSGVVSKIWAGGSAAISGPLLSFPS